MVNWTKKTPLFNEPRRSKEIWIREYNGKTEEFPVELYLGKKTDLLKLKKSIINDLDEKIAYYRDSRKELYAQEDMEYVSSCPVTGISSEECTPVANIYGAQYVQSPDTGHVFVKFRPGHQAINNFYLNNVTYAATYTDKSAAESRLEAIAVPWCDWTLQVYEQNYGKKPKRILDVGSGAGHFVEACKRRGIEAQGIELSESSRNFSREIWGFELDGRDFNEVWQEYEGYDIVTFWGLLEHTPNPGMILKNAHKIVSKSPRGGMVIAKVPRWDSLSSAAQRLNPETIIRHIDPMGHIMLFTDASAAELYKRNGFNPCAAWYYGMDVYETFMQVRNRTKSEEVLSETGFFQVELQQFIDEAKFADGLVLVGLPE